MFLKTVYFIAGLSKFKYALIGNLIFVRVSSFQDLQVVKPLKIYTSRSKTWKDFQVRYQDLHVWEQKLNVQEYDLKVPEPYTNVNTISPRRDPNFEKEDLKC